MVAFLRIQTQWCWICPGDGSAHRTGLDYTRVERGLAMAEIAMTPELFASLQIIEAGALAAHDGEPSW